MEVEETERRRWLEDGSRREVEEQIVVDLHCFRRACIDICDEGREKWRGEKEAPL
jgi:hypothetical protein